MNDFYVDMVLVFNQFDGINSVLASSLTSLTLQLIWTSWLNLAGGSIPQDPHRDRKFNKAEEPSNSAASATTQEPRATLDTADSGSPRKLAAEAILPESSSSLIADFKVEPQGYPDLKEPDEALDLENIREQAMQCDDLFDEGFDFFDTNGGGEVGALPTLLRSNSSSSSMTDSSCYSKDLWAELACHMTISDGTFGSNISDESTLSASMETGRDIRVEDLDLEDVGTGNAELVAPGSPEVEMLDTSSLMNKKQSWTALINEPSPKSSSQLLQPGGSNLDWQPGVFPSAPVSPRSPQT